MKIPKAYRDILNKCFPNPPRNVPEIWMKIQEKYTTNIEYVYKGNQIVGCCTVVIINDGFYGINWVAIYPEYQNQGYGTKLLKRITDTYKGVFITKTRDASRFYKSLGWNEIWKDENHTVFCYMNDIGKIDF